MLSNVMKKFPFGRFITHYLDQQGPAGPGTIAPPQVETWETNKGDGRSPRATGIPATGPSSSVQAVYQNSGLKRVMQRTSAPVDSPNMDGLSVFALDDILGQDPSLCIKVLEEGVLKLFILVLAIQGGYFYAKVGRYAYVHVYIYALCTGILESFFHLKDQVSRDRTSKGY